MKGGAVSFLGPKSRPLLVVNEHVLDAAWRTDTQTSDGEGEPYVVESAVGPPLVLNGVTGVATRSNRLGQSQYFVLEGDEHLPAAIVPAQRTTAIRIGGLASSPTNTLSSLAIATQADGRIMVLGVDTSIAPPAANVVCRTELDDGSWSGWEVVGGGRLTAVSAEIGPDGRVMMFGCDADTAPDNIFQCVQTAPNGPWDGRWTRIRGILTSVSVARAHDGRLLLTGANAGITGSGSNTFLTEVPPGGFQGSPANVQWSGGGMWATTVAAAIERDGKWVMLGVRSVGGWNDNVSIARRGTAVQGIGERFDSVAAARRIDGRLHFFGTHAAAWNGTRDSVQSTPNGAWGPWSAMTIRLDQIAATSGPDGRIHVVGVSNADPERKELVIRSELVAGGEWSGWRPLEDGVLR